MAPINDTTRNKVLARFQENPLVTGSEFQALLNVHKRSVFRVISELRDRGHVIKSDSSGYKYVRAPKWD